MYICSTGDYYADVDDVVPELKTLLKETLGTSVRRIDRFIQLALIGAGRCIQNSCIKSRSVQHPRVENGVVSMRESLPEDTAVYLASGRGDMEITVDVQQQLFEHGQPPKPLSFINTVSNAACFYIAQTFALRGRSNFVCSAAFAFESALQLAHLDINSGTVNTALVGVVDVVVPPLADHRQRLHLETEAPLAEASHWLWLRREKPEQQRCCQLVAIKNCVDWTALVQWLDALQLPAAQTHISSGQRLPAIEMTTLKDQYAMTNELNYRAHRGHYDCQSGAAIAEFMRSNPKHADYFLHINGDGEGRYCAMLIQYLDA